MKSMKSPYDKVLLYYDLKPVNIEDLGKVKKITTNRGVYALKETSMTKQQADDCIHALRKLSRLGYHQYVPIYPTKYGEYTVNIGVHTYYLMPWVETLEYTAKESPEEKLAAQIGVIHRLTVKTQPFQEDNVNKSFQQLHKSWEIKRLELMRFADESERKIYLSPFELTFLTHAHMLDQMSQLAIKHLEKWYDICLEKGTYRTVLSHGRIHRSHALFSVDNEPYFINFENACINNPAHDLANFCRYSFSKAYWSDEEVMRWFLQYEKHLPLLEDEKYLTSAYLNFPEPIVYAVSSYVSSENGMSELAHVNRLEKRLTSMKKVQSLTQYLIHTNENE